MASPTTESATPIITTRADRLADAVFGPIWNIINLAKNIFRALSFYDLWKPSETSLSLQGRLVDYRNTLKTIAGAPFVIVGAEITAIIGIFHPATADYLQNRYLPA